MRMTAIGWLVIALAWPMGSIAQGSQSADLAGADANGNGVRDDIEQVLEENAELNRSQTAAVFSMARTLQALIIEGAALGPDPFKVTELRDELAAPIACLMFLLPNIEEYTRINNLVERQLVNTPARLRAYQDAIGLLRRSPFPAKPVAQVSCDQMEDRN